MGKIAGMLAARFYREDNSLEVSYDSFKYAVEFALEMLAGILVSILFAFCFKMVWETVLFLSVFWILRSYAGGIHLDKFSHCFVFSSCVIAGTLLIVKYSHVPLWVSYVMMAGGATALLLTEPENDKNRMVDEEEEVYFRKRLRQSLFLIVIVYLLFALADGSKYTFLIALTTDIVYVMMILGKVKNKSPIGLVFDFSIGKQYGKKKNEEKQ